MTRDPLGDLLASQAARWRLPSWYRMFARGAAYHAAGPDWLTSGMSLCGRVDLTRAGFVADSLAQAERTGERVCKRCVARYHAAFPPATAS